jgi:hypothetical protein
MFFRYFSLSRVLEITVFVTGNRLTQKIRLDLIITAKTTQYNCTTCSRIVGINKLTDTFC